MSGSSERAAFRSIPLASRTGRRPTPLRAPVRVRDVAARARGDAAHHVRPGSIRSAPAPPRPRRERERPLRSPSESPTRPPLRGGVGLRARRRRRGRRRRWASRERMLARSAAAERLSAREERERRRVRRGGGR
eukprot:scaffold115699_cov28-Tisochrysis_lutea.AAC.3